MPNTNNIEQEIERIAAQRWDETGAQIWAERRKRERRRDLHRTAHIILIVLAWTGIAFVYYHKRLSWREAGLLMVFVLWIDLWMQNRRHRKGDE